MESSDAPPLEKQKADVQACLDVIVASNASEATIAGLDILHKLI